MRSRNNIVQIIVHTSRVAYTHINEHKALSNA